MIRTILVGLFPLLMATPVNAAGIMVGATSPFRVPTLVASPQSKQLCSGALAQEKGYIVFKPDAANTSLWCDAEIPETLLPKLLKVCSIGARCQIGGTFMGHGTFVWDTITSVKKLGE